jgi:anaerobic selenocysteine-containing dehydrogenase
MTRMEETTRRRTVFRSCSLCEAMCGLRFEVEDDRIVSVRPDDDDVFSHGYVCPKGIAYADIHHDPDRLRSPMRRQADGTFAAISWPEALDLVATRLGEVRARHGADAVAVYFGNPAAHDHGAIAMRDGFMRTLGTRNSYGASSQDTNPRFATSYYLYGSSFVIPVPDVDRTAYLLCLGGNPLVSQGSFACAPNMRARLRGIRARGGRVVVVDPRRSETAREADEHVAIRPGGDAAFLLAMVQVLVARGRVDRERLERVTTGWEAIERRLAAFTPERAARYAGVPAQTIERLALEFADAPSATAYSRIGVCNSAFGTLGTYATDLLNLVAGRLGEVGGAMFPTPAFDVARLAYVAGMDGHARWQTRVRGLPETIGDLPAAALAEEIETPGAGQIRALVTIAGNPALSVPNGRRLAAALPTLDFMVALDFYVTETSRHADVILPPASTLTGDHVDVLLYSWTVRNVARWSPPVVARAPEERADWEILLEIAYRLGGGPTGRRWVDRLFRAARRFGVHWNPTAFVTLMLRTGPYGDRFLPGSRGLNMRKLRQAPHGVDLGPLEPGLARRVLHRDRRVRLAPEPILRAMDGLARTLERPPQETPLLLIGRRQLRSNNSWMHNVASLVSGRERCVLLVHPEDAARAGVADGGTAILESRTYRGELPVRVSDEMRPGVVSLPHGWGHAASAPWQRVAGEHAGVSANDWTDESEVESVVGQSILNGVPVSLRAVAAEKRA